MKLENFLELPKCLFHTHIFGFKDWDGGGPDSAEN